MVKVFTYILNPWTTNVCVTNYCFLLVSVVLTGYYPLTNLFNVFKVTLIYSRSIIFTTTSFVQVFSNKFREYFTLVISYVS